MDKTGDKTLNDDNEKTEMILGTIIDVGENSIEGPDTETFEQKMDKMTAARKAYEQNQGVGGIHRRNDMVAFDVGKRDEGRRRHLTVYILVAVCCTLLVIVAILIFGILGV